MKLIKQTEKLPRKSLSRMPWTLASKTSSIPLAISLSLSLWGRRRRSLKRGWNLVLSLEVICCKGVGLVLGWLQLRLRVFYFIFLIMSLRLRLYGRTKSRRKLRTCWDWEFGWTHIPVSTGPCSPALPSCYIYYILASQC